ncbi:hypothetical protein ACFV1U_37450 [Streptomyces microflavus]|uniref:hypothetical protein n=1 Tax=Streptomyces microflavus TaxID=1919 RepID=UPI00367CB0BE
MTTTTAPDSAAPESVAAALFVGAFNTVYEDGPCMTIAVHLGTGSSLAVTGRLGDDYHMHFDPAEVSAALDWLTRAVATDPHAIITVTTDRSSEGDTPQSWAWFIDNGDPLSASEAASLFPGHTELLGVKQPWVTLHGPRPLVDTSAEGLANTALTHEVKAVTTAHGQPRPAASHHIALRLDGTVSIDVAAADVPRALDALKEIENEEFHLDLTTRHGHLITYITLGDADTAELVSAADVLPNDITD